MRLGEGLTGQVIVKQAILHVTDLQNAPETRNEPLIRREGFVTYIGIPLIVKGQIKGVFEIFHRSQLSPTLDWMEFLHTLAGQASDRDRQFAVVRKSAAVKPGTPAGVRHYPGRLGAGPGTEGSGNRGPHRAELRN